MSKTFILPNNYDSTLTLKQVLELCDEVDQYNFDGDDQSIFDQTIEDIEFLILGSSEELDLVSARGFEFGYDSEDYDNEGNDFYYVRVNTPSSINDWKLAIKFIKALSLKLNTYILDEDNEQYTVDTLDNLDYTNDIYSGIKAMQDILQKQENADSLTLPGLFFDLYFNSKIVDKLLASSNPVEAFSNFVTEIYSLDAFPASQQLFEKDGEIKAIYIIQSDIPLILLKEARLTFDNSNLLDSPDQVSQWNAVYLKRDTDELLEMPYDKFIANLPEDKITLLDDNNILVSPLTTDEIESYFQE